MPGEVFYWIFNMSITASVTGLVLLLLRKTKKIPRRLIFVLWIIPFLRMWLPVSIGSRYGLMEMLSRMGIKTVTVYDEGRSPITAMNSVGAADSYFPMVYKANLLEQVFNIAFVVWLIGCIVFLGILAFLYVGVKRELRHTIHWQDNIWLSEQAVTPAVYGIFRPRIVVPATYKDKEMRYILAHEKAHIRRLDNLWRILGFVTACVHWFNPFSWLFLKLFLEDIEFSCDERVIRGLDKEERKAYASALVDCVEGNNALASAFGGSKIHRRIYQILSYKKISVFSAVCFVVLAAAVACALLTNGV